MIHKIVDDGFASYLVENAHFSGKWEIPIIKSENLIPPMDIVPFDKRKQVIPAHRENVFIHFYMHDITFKRVVKNPSKYKYDLMEFGGIISPDGSLYIDMPLCLQLANTYFNRAVGVYMQNNGIPVIPNVRWGDERTYSFAFSGLEKEGIYSISTLGCIRSREEKRQFTSGLEEMIIQLNPKQILVHGTMPDSVFKDYIDKVRFINYESWTSRVKRRAYGNK